MSRLLGDLIAVRSSRKFAALATATGATLVTRDDHLLQAGEMPGARILTPSQLRKQMETNE
jgi:predicted nucleic acid-binding protein